MSKITFTRVQIENLLKNKNVLRCSSKSITYNKNFKIRAIKMYEQGLGSQGIFIRAGFDLDVIGRKKPQDCLIRWNRVFRRSGSKGLSEAKGKNGQGRPNTKNLTDEEKIKRLETEVAYLKEERDFLAKLRAKRAESNSGLNRNIR